MDIDYSTRRVIAIAVIALLVMALIMYMPGAVDSLPNRVGAITGVGTLGILCAVASTFKPWQLGALFSGVFLILTGIGLYVLMGSFGEAAKAASSAGKFTSDDVKFWTYGIELWRYTVPVISMAIGVNIISSFISATPPLKEVEH